MHEDEAPRRVGEANLTRHRTALCRACLRESARGRHRGPPAGKTPRQKLIRRDGQIGQAGDVRRKGLQRKASGERRRPRASPRTTSPPPNRPECRRSRWRRDRNRRSPRPTWLWSRARSRPCARAAPARRPASRPTFRIRPHASWSNGSSCAASTTASTASATSPSSPPIRVGRASCNSAAAPGDAWVENIAGAGAQLLQTPAAIGIGRMVLARCSRRGDGARGRVGARPGATMDCRRTSRSRCSTAIPSS
jgi:hypothetical protein